MGEPNELARLSKELFCAFNEKQRLWKKLQKGSVELEEYQAACRKYLEIRDTVSITLKEEDQKKERKHREKILAKVKLEEGYLKDAVVIRKGSGFTHVFYGGLDKGNGIGHGHIVLDQNENITYVRRPTIERYFNQEFQASKNAE